MSDRPNILVLLADEHNPHTLGCYGSTLVKTPAIDRLAAEGVLFEDAYCNAPLCAPSRYSFMSGRRPWQAKAWSNKSEPPVHLPSIASHLSQHGYQTAAIGKMHYSGEEQLWGFECRPYGDFRGLSHQPDPIRTAPGLTFVRHAGPAEIPEEKTQESIVNRLGIKFLREHDRSRPFCLWLSYNRPHFPVRPPQPYFDEYFPDAADLPEVPVGHTDALHPWMAELRRFFRGDRFTSAEIRRARAAYYGCVTFIDDKVAEVLDVLAALDLLRDTVVVYFSDHGEMLGEHGLWRKSCFYDAAVRVPLIVRWPGKLPHGRRVRETVELVDLFPTLAEIAGTPEPQGMEGSSLIGLAKAGAGAKGYALSEYTAHAVPGPMRMVKAGDWKLIWYLDAKPSLFNLKEDPGEFEDRIEDPSRQRLIRDLEGLLQSDGWETQVRKRLATFQAVDKPNVRDFAGTPNQYLLPGGEIVDAEDFYPGVIWEW